MYIDLRPSQACHSKVMHRKEVTHSDGSYEKKSCWRAWLKRWDKVKIPWYTHRLMHRKRVTCELHDNYFHLMTIKHAIPKILSGRLNYYITRYRQEVSEFGDKTSWWEDVGMRTCPKEARPPSPRLSSPGERERHTAMSGGAGKVNMLQSLFSLQLPLTVKPWVTLSNLSNKVRGIFFHHTTCESTRDTLTSSAAYQGDNTVSVAQGGTATPGATKQLLPPDRVFKRNIYLYIHKIN